MAVLLVVAVVGALVLSTLRRHLSPILIGTGCVVRASYSLPLSTGQAAIAATIAGVAQRRSMPARAVAIAYATALQESDLADLPYGDRDSVGVFQQRPSQGWGPRADLLDPAYASGKFFAALAEVPGYLNLPIYQAAQDVQHSADGSAYAQWATMGADLATGFTGSASRSVWCWYGTGVTGPAHLASAIGELGHVFGRLATGQSGPGITLVQASPATAGLATVRVAAPASGWTVAAWLVTHADQYGIRKVRYAGYQWTASAGQAGWTRLASSSQIGSTDAAVAFG